MKTQTDEQAWCGKEESLWIIELRERIALRKNWWWRTKERAVDLWRKVSIWWITPRECPKGYCVYFDGEMGDPCWALSKSKIFFWGEHRPKAEQRAALKRMPAAVLGDVRRGHDLTSFWA